MAMNPWATRAAWGLIVAWGGVVGRPASAQDVAAPAVVEAPADPTSQKPGEKPRLSRRAAEKEANRRVTRADLAAAYLRMEREYLAHPPQGERNAEVNRAFDQATMAFFMGKNSEAVRALSELGQSLRPEPAAPAERALLSLKVTLDPAVWPVGKPTLVKAKVQSLYEPRFDEVVELTGRLRVVAPDGKPLLEKAFELEVGDGSLIDRLIAFGLPVEEMKGGLYRVELSSGDVTNSVAQASAVEGDSLDMQRRANTERLAKIEAPSPALAAALATCRARNNLLDSKSSTANSAQFLADYAALVRDVRTEIDALAAGKDPYHRRAGDYWRVMPGGESEIPLRVYAPTAATSDTPAPLLIVLHGAGGDENMFLEAYGGGRIKQIAEERGLLIASPLTYKFGGDPQNLDRLVAALGHDYAIDSQRIYVLGHSMGAGAAASLARTKGDVLAAACCLAGGGSLQSKTGLAPTLSIVAELDGVIPPQGLQAAAEKAISEGAPVELRTMPDFGHTLVVGRVLPDAVDWLLDHKLGVLPAK